MTDFGKTFVYKIEQYNSNCFRIIKYNCNVFGKKNKSLFVNEEKNDNIDSDYLESSVSRSKRNIRRICLSNEFEYFCTWTVSSELADRFSVQNVQDKMREVLKDYQKKSIRYKEKIKNKRDKNRFQEFKYIYVIEKHKDGALHFHGLVKGFIPGDLVEYNENDFERLPYYILDTIHKGRKIYFSKTFSENLGYCTFTKINNYNACCNYIIKYISKDPVRNENDQIYFCSRGLTKGESWVKTSISKKFLDNGFDYFDDSGQLICTVKDIYIDNFNKDTRIDFITEVLDPDTTLF